MCIFILVCMDRLKHQYGAENFSLIRMWLDLSLGQQCKCVPPVEVKKIRVCPSDELRTGVSHVAFHIHPLHGHRSFRYGMLARIHRYSYSPMVVEKAMCNVGEQRFNDKNLLDRYRVD